MKKSFLHTFKILSVFILLFCFTIPVFAQQNDFNEATTKTLIPEVNKNRFKSNYDCTNLMITFEDIYFFELDTDQNAEVGSMARFFEAIKVLNTGGYNQGADRLAEGASLGQITSNDILGCSIMTGRVSLSYLSLFVSYALRMLSIAAGTISILFIIFGGYQYVIGGITESQDAAKSTIKNAIIGLVVSTGAWIIVNIVLALLT